MNELHDGLIHGRKSPTLKTNALPGTCRYSEGTDVSRTRQVLIAPYLEGTARGADAILCIDFGRHLRKKVGRVDAP